VKQKHVLVCAATIDIRLRILAALSSLMTQRQTDLTVTTIEAGQPPLAAQETLPDLIIIASQQPADTPGDPFLTPISDSGYQGPILLIDDNPPPCTNEVSQPDIRAILSMGFTAEDLTTAVKQIIDPPTRLDTLLPSLLKAADTGIAVLDEQQTLLFCNDRFCHFFGIKYASHCLNQPLDKAVQHTELAALFTGAEAGATLGEVKLDAGIILNVQITKLEDGSGLLLLRDVTQQKQMLANQSAFVQRVSRDIRSPLTTIRGYAELLDRVGPINAQQQQFIDRISYSTQAINLLLSDLLDLQEIETGYHDDWEPTHLGMIVRYAVEARRQQMVQNQQEIVVAVENISPIDGNPAHLRQMIVNLLDNAASYMSAGGTLRISLSQADEFAVLQIADDGRGIAAKDQPHIFEEFYRPEKSPDESTSTGLRMAIVRSIVDKHNGRIWLESQEGKGTTVTIMLPTKGGHSDSMDL
jgi:signal transduction histidine kinase